MIEARAGADAQYTAPVSVVIPCFRCSGTIVRALDSVDHQSLRPREVIIVDDGSGDGTIDFLHGLKLRFRDGWLNIIALDANSGPGSARNRGVDFSTQPYVAFLDADDSWHSDKIRIQYEWMTRHPDIVLSGHGYVVCDNNTGTALPVAGFDQYMIGKRQMLLSNRLSTPTVMLKREVPFRFAEGKRYAEDYLLWLRIIIGAGQAGFLDVPLAFLHKSAYGGSGLSGRMWDMEKGELECYRILASEGSLSRPLSLLLRLYSYSKFLRRLSILHCKSFGSRIGL
jgi:glycosyltransferase involved in cell wall biosynthesis